jgi:hypothetical protein
MIAVLRIQFQESVLRDHTPRNRPYSGEGGSVSDKRPDTVGEPQLDFIQLRSIAERFSEAFQHYSWDFNHVGLLLER